MSALATHASTHTTLNMPLASGVYRGGLPIRRELAGRTLFKARRAPGHATGHVTGHAVQRSPGRRTILTTSNKTENPGSSGIDLNALFKYDEMNIARENDREGRRVVFSPALWQKHRSSARYSRALSTFFESSVLMGLVPPVAGCAVVAAAVCGWNNYEVNTLLNDPWVIDLIPFSLSTSALSLLLVFRTTSSYDRWWEARKEWGGLLNRTRDFCRQGITWFDDRDEILKAQLVRYTVAYAYALKVHLRSDAEDMQKTLAPILKTNELEAALDNVHVPNHLLKVISNIVREAGLTTFQTAQMDENITFFHDVLGKCERILKTPIPLSYTRITSRFTLVWLLFLPFALWKSCGIATIPTEVFVALALLGIEDIGVQIEEPFSVLACEVICGSVAMNTCSILAMQDRDNALIADKATVVHNVNA